MLFLLNIALFLVFNVDGYGYSHTLRTSRMTSLKGFSDPNWNWGSSVGTGHDAAMKLRIKLGTSDKRTEFIKSIVDNSDDFSLEDVKLALALRFQRASREGISGSEEGYKIMEKMARRKYESVEGADILLRDLQDLCCLLPVDLVAEAGSPNGGGLLQYEAAKVLCGMKFCTLGL